MMRLLVTALALVVSVRAQTPITALGAATAPSAVASRSVAPAPGPSTMSDVANLFATMTAVNASFPDKTTLVLSGVSPVVTFLSTAPMPHGGTWNVSQFTGIDMDTPTGWLGTPDATLEGVLANGTKMTVMLGYLDQPVFDNETNTVSISTRMLPATDGLALLGGVTNAAAFGLAPRLATELPTGNMTNVALFIDLATKKSVQPEIQASKSGTAVYNFERAYGISVRQNTLQGSDLQVRMNDKLTNREDFRQTYRQNTQSI